MRSCVLIGTVSEKTEAFRQAVNQLPVVHIGQLNAGNKDSVLPQIDFLQRFGGSRNDRYIGKTPGRQRVPDLMAEFTAADRKCNNNTAQGQPSCLLRKVGGFSETSSYLHIHPTTEIMR